MKLEELFIYFPDYNTRPGFVCSKHHEQLSISPHCCSGNYRLGKSTLAATIAHKLHIPHYELDAISWEPNWTEAPREATRERVEALTRTEAWVTDGNYSFCRDIIWSRLEAVIWLDYPLAVILWQLWRRTWRRVIKKELLWGTNYERLWPQFFSKDSLFLWALKTYKRRKRTYAALFALPRIFTHKVVSLQIARRNGSVVAIAEMDADQAKINRTTFKKR